MTIGSILSLIVFVAAAVAAASAGAIFRPGRWYREELAKPPWRPPDWLFGPVWMVLYAMIAVSGWLVYEAAGLAGAGTALGIYAAQLVLNWGWSALFFGLRSPGLGLVEVAGLWLSIIATIVAFLPIHTGAGLLLLPYLAWVSFAMILNFRIWQLNQRGRANAT